MWIRSIVALPVLLAACERPTAPEALGIARRAEQDFANGDISAIASMFMSMGSAGWMWGSNYAHRNHALNVRVDGRRSRINAFVIESVVYPPAGRGEPTVERTLVAWPDDLAFAFHARADSVPSFVINVPEPERPWTLRSGKLAIGTAGGDRGCPTSGESMPQLPSSGVTCELASFDVDFRGTFLRRSLDGTADAASAPLDVEIRRQRIPGVRFVVSCAASDERGQSPTARETGYREMECSGRSHRWRPPVAGNP
jgi:hypothetical protein